METIEGLIPSLAVYDVSTSLNKTCSLSTTHAHQGCFKKDQKFDLMDFVQLDLYVRTLLLRRDS